MTLLRHALILLTACAAIGALCSPDAEAGKSPLDAIKAAAPPCPEAAAHCYGLRIHVVVKNKQPVQSAAWIASRLDDANKRFEGAGIGFEVVEVRALSPALFKIRTRKDRDRLTLRRYKRGLIDVFIVGRLDNVDGPGEINGVHWRSRINTNHQYVIMSRIAWDLVMGHELGHFFGLPHSEHPDSIMNKSKDPDRPPVETWSFHPDELALIEDRRALFARRGVVAERRPAP